MAGIIGSRMTRSQSREASNKPSKGRNAAGQSGRKRLSNLAEEPSTPGFAASNQMVPESPEIHEGHTNVSGTTLGHNDVEPIDSQVGMKITNHLFFIQEQASLVMNLLVPQELNPDLIAAEAKRFENLTHPNAKRLKRSFEGMNDEVNDSPLSLNGKTFLNIPQVRRLLSPTQFETSIPNLHMTNCALLALNIFFSKGGTCPEPQVIQELDAGFPVCFMNDVAEDSKSRAIGSSNTQDSTFNLALSIRTHFFIMELQRRQQEPDFNPFSILRQIFCMDLIPSEDSFQESPGSFRGFNLPGVFQDEDCHLPVNLPDKFQIAVSDRFNELHEEISEWEDDCDVVGLKKAYRWRSVERDLARWIHTRSREIKEDIRRLSEIQAQQSPARRFTPALLGTPNRREASTVPLSAEPPRQVPPIQNAQSPQKERPVNEAIENNSPPPANSPQKASGPVVAEPVPKDPARRKSKSNYRDASSFAALKRRMDISRQQSFSNVASHPPNRSVTTNIEDQSMDAGPSTGHITSEPREIHESPDPSYTDLADDFTYVNNDEELDLGQDHEGGVLASTSPSASARINRVSHNPNLYFDSPNNQRSRQAAERSSHANDRSKAHRRLFIEKQKNAGKVSPISYADTQSAERRRDVPPHAKSNKRQNPFNDSSDDSDDTSSDFEQDTRDTGRRPEKRQRFQGGARGESVGNQLQLSLNDARQTSQGLPNSTHMPRVKGREDSEEDITDGETIADQTSPARRLPFQTPSTGADDSHWAKVKARATDPSLNKRKPTSRWSEKEDERLLKLMGLYGTSYALVKKADSTFPASGGGPLLEDRSQVQCKDRARNLKKKFEREGQAVPKCLASIKV